MKKKKKKIVIICSLIVSLFLGIFIYNRVMLWNEAELRKPIGQMVSVNGHELSLYIEGNGPKTLVFMAGGGTCSPILDFKSLYSKLSDDFKIVVVEKLGYGFSDTGHRLRDIDSILSDTRGALKAAGIVGPYILCPHSMSGIEAIYWAQKYPKEVEGVIGLDMATPYHYEHMKINVPLLSFTRGVFIAGVGRLLPNIWKGDAVIHGNLSEEEKNIYKAVFYDKTLSGPMIKEAKSIKNNAAYVRELGLPQIPLLMFISNGKGTGMKEALWQEYSKMFVDNVENGEIIILDCPHYVHDYLYDYISEEIKIFLGTL